MSQSQPKGPGRIGPVPWRQYWQWISPYFWQHLSWLQLLVADSMNVDLIRLGLEDAHLLGRKAHRPSVKSFEDSTKRAEHDEALAQNERPVEAG
jgi:hypothetical protein